MRKSSERDGSGAEGAVSLTERRLASGGFAELFREGMALVEESAAYLDGTGRVESRDLTRSALTAYAQQSMRLSTRLMQLASWLLLQRAVSEGEMSLADAKREGTKIDLKGPPRESEQEEHLPTTLRELVARSYDLQRRIGHIDEVLSPAPEAAKASGANAVANQIGRLRTAFERR